MALFALRKAQPVLDIGILRVGRARLDKLGGTFPLLCLDRLLALDPVRVVLSAASSAPMLALADSEIPPPG
jgi:hypothetical protein